MKDWKEGEKWKRGRQVRATENGRSALADDLAYNKATCFLFEIHASNCASQKMGERQADI